ncbi:hypothetical protein EPO34_03025 [Patescibacteria group bacterium]|nr:MAG: hypothetical protein EPO34_03025 [Patescibacteria group bacterium]
MPRTRSIVGSKIPLAGLTGGHLPPRHDQPPPEDTMPEETRANARDRLDCGLGGCSAPIIPLPFHLPGFYPAVTVRAVIPKPKPIA